MTRLNKKLRAADLRMEWVERDAEKWLGRDLRSGQVKLTGREG